MGQVPFDANQTEVFTSYLLIGNGRVGRHFSRYFDLESIPYKSWSRNEDLARLRTCSEEASHILLAISDPSIESFYRTHEFLRGKTVVHFSGALSIAGLPGAHPLMAFADELYDLETYRRIPFVVETGWNPAAILPRLTNPVHFVDPARKPLYHALCAMSGNFTVLLWEKVFREFESTLALPRETLFPYMERIVQNLAQAPSGTSVLTGPLARGDRDMVERHLSVLKNDPYENVYRAFVTAFDAAKKTKA